MQKPCDTVTYTTHTNLYAVFSLITPIPWAHQFLKNHKIETCHIIYKLARKTFKTWPPSINKLTKTLRLFTQCARHSTAGYTNARVGHYKSLSIAQLKLFYLMHFICYLRVEFPTLSLRDFFGLREFRSFSSARNPLPAPNLLAIFT